MTKTHLLQAVCAVAMLAATPALAQRPEAGMTNANGTPNPAAAHPAPATGSNAPANDGADSMSMATPNGSSGSHYSHRPAMAHEQSGAMSQDAAVNRLNDESYHAAQQGQAFKVGSADTGAAATPTPARSMPAADGSGSK